jgi:hypothetical protein
LSTEEARHIADGLRQDELKTGSIEEGRNNPKSDDWRVVCERLERQQLVGECLHIVEFDQGGLR